jgi:hypothetical protein
LLQATHTGLEEAHRVSPVEAPQGVLHISVFLQKGELMTTLLGGVRRIPIGLLFLLIAVLVVLAAVFVLDVLPLLHHAFLAVDPDLVSHRP